MGTRRFEEMMIDARSQAYCEDFSSTEGWDDNVLVQIGNLALNQIYRAITKINNPANIEQYTDDIVANQQSYDIPIDVFMSIRIVDVRYKYGAQDDDYVELYQSSIQDRTSFSLSTPSYYIIRDGKLLLNPIPSESKTNGLIVNYQKRMRSLDVRRGILASKTDSPVTITLSFTSTSEKNANMQTNANSVLDKRDSICLVETDGTPIVTDIKVNNYNKTTQVITAESDYSFPASQLTDLDSAIAAGKDIYVVSGKYSSTHSELDSQCEDFLIEFMIARLLRLQSSTTELVSAINREKEVMKDLVESYRRYRPNTYPIKWIVNQNRSRSCGRNSGIL